MLYVYVTHQCLQDAATINTQDDIDVLSKKITYEQSTLGLERHPYPFLKKRIGRTRVVMAEVVDGEDVVLCFLRHVYKKDIGDNYDAFFKTLQIPSLDDTEFVEFLNEMRATPVITKAPPSELELEYLVLDRNQEMGRVTILESKLWVSTIKIMKETPGKQGLLTPIWELLQELCEDDGEDRASHCERRHQRHGVRVIYRHFPESNHLFLVAPLESTEDGSAHNVVAAQELLDNSADFDREQLLRNGARAYPDFILYDREVWESTQASVDANLALSPEEGDVLAHVLDPTQQGGFPLFINGRPGSGKSTILQYLFAEYLHAHLARPDKRQLSHPPLYLTYNERLLDNARKLVEEIFHCGAEKLATSESVDLKNEHQKSVFDSAFVYFREFLLSLVEGREFDRKKYVDYYRFRALYVSNTSHGPDSKLRRLAPEVAWHTLRTYIKGKNAGESEYFDPESYQELPRDEITVTPETFELVWDKVWNGWYRSLCEKEGFWDDQDLARYVLDRELVPSTYPAVFCDESQDFTSIELELIFRLSCYSSKRIDHYYLRMVPYAFAGDPFQTLNPTGFRWDAIKANFHDNIVRQLAPDAQGKVSFTFKELAYNYRSTANIVRFCNLIQLKRGKLFDIPDVSPQRAWALDKGAWPAYFEIDIGTEARLKEQSELVIIVPCQEGEEKSFVEDDEYLRGIALDSKGEITRNVLSPMRAKGLEFGRVVLYMFGAQAVRDRHVEVMRALDTQGKTFTREDTLGLEYFFNGLYVAASRAQKRLLIVDSTDGLKEFWPFATDPERVGQLLEERRRTLWIDDDMQHMVRGELSTWAEDRDDPKSLADRFYEQGKLDQSVYLLQLARNQYSALNDAEKTERCTALIHDLEEEYLDAAYAYERLGELAEAIRCFWEAKEYGKVSETATRDPGRFGLSPFAIAARFMIGNRTAERAAQFIRELTEARPERRREQFKRAHWSEILQLTLKVLCNTEGEENDARSKNSEELLRILYGMEREDGLVIEKTVELALLAYEAGEPYTALDIWKDLKRKGTDHEPGFVLRSRAMTSPYPQRLRWYDQVDDLNSVILEYKKNLEVELDAECHDIVMRALMAKKDYSSVIRLLKTGATWYSMRHFLSELTVSKEDKDTALSLFGIYMRKGLDGGDFRQVIEDLKPGKTTIPAFSALLDDDDFLLKSESALIRLLARNANLLDERKDDKYVSGTILTIAKKRALKLKEFVSFDEVGSALERAGRMDNALGFYELVFKNKLWGVGRDTENKAKARWLKCKQRQANLTQKDEKRRNQRLAEAKKMSAEWGIPIPNEIYPPLKDLAPHEIDMLFENLFVQVVDEKATDKGESTQSLTQDRTSPNEQQGSLFWGLPQRQAYDGQIEFVCDFDGVRINAHLLPNKKRLELRDESNGDLVMIRVPEVQVESYDVAITYNDSKGWQIPPWALNVNLIQANPEATLVDISNDDGQRIICLAI